MSLKTLEIELKHQQEQLIQTLLDQVALKVFQLLQDLKLIILEEQLLERTVMQFPMMGDNLMLQMVVLV